MDSNAAYDIGLIGIRHFLLGSKKPVLITRVLCWTSFAVFAWVFGWYLLNLIALHMVETMPNSDHLKSIFIALGEKYHHSDIINSCKYMAWTGTSGALLVFAGAVLRWREFAIGFWLIIIGLLSVIASPVIFIGVNYLINEQAWFEYTVPGLVLIFAFLEKWITSRA